jgi:hypothetical protein
VIEREKASRLAREHEALVRDRKRSFSDCYKNYLRKTFSSNPVNQYLLFPRVEDVFTFEAVSEFLSREQYSDQALENNDRAEVVVKLDGLILAWIDERQKALAAMLPPLVSNGGMEMTASNSGTASDTRLALATSVFQCATKSCIATREQKDARLILIGWEGVAGHSCSRSGSYWLESERTIATVKYSERGSLAVSSILQLLRLDARTTFPADLDRLDLMLTCALCPITVKGRRALSWRDAVSSVVSLLNA